MKTFVFLLVASVAFAFPKGPEHRFKTGVPFLDGRIVGGKNATIEDYPYQVSVSYFGSHLCGGSILSEKYVVTAAHCTDGKSSLYFAVRVNSSVLDRGGREIVVSAVHQNPNFNDDLQYDISILELDEPIEFGTGAQPVTLPAANETVPAGTTVTVTGWGTLHSGDNVLPDQLQVVEVSLVDFDECVEDYRNWIYHVYDSMLCAAVPEGGKDACQGDSGGPLAVNGTLWGIVSWGNGCALSDYPGVYSDVSYLRDFITEVTGL